MPKGKAHEYEPEVDSICMVAFDEAPGESPLDSRRAEWMMTAGKDALRAANILPSGGGEEDPRWTPLMMGFLEEVLAVGEDVYWTVIEHMVNTAGYDTYNGDAIFEVFDPEVVKAELVTLVPAPPQVAKFTVHHTTTEETEVEAPSAEDAVREAEDNYNGHRWEVVDFAMFVPEAVDEAMDRHPAGTSIDVTEGGSRDEYVKLQQSHLASHVILNRLALHEVLDRITYEVWRFNTGVEGAESVLRTIDTILQETGRSTR